MAKLTINGEVREYAVGTTFEEVAKDFQTDEKSVIALVLENGKMRELSKVVRGDAEIGFIRLNERLGHKTLRNGR